MKDEKFGLLTVLREVDDPRQGRHYQCLCECGVEKVIRGTALRSGHIKSCGCQKHSGLRAKGGTRTVLTNQKFGMLTAIERIPRARGSKGGALWRCLCDCGNFVNVRGGLLVSGNNKSCGCAGNLSRPFDITGKRFGKLIALERMPLKSGSSYMWLCRCDCGEMYSASIGNLNGGQTQSCGCVKTRELTFAQHTARKRMRKNAAIPKWFSEWDEFVEGEAYLLTVRRKTETGIAWSVDHMVPIRADVVCGLHCGDNLQVIPSSLNSAKRNRLVFTERYEWLRA